MPQLAKTAIDVVALRATHGIPSESAIGIHMQPASDVRDDFPDCECPGFGTRNLVVSREEHQSLAFDHGLRVG